jgi:predicted acylesterase/phospholipase RssA
LPWDYRRVYGRDPDEQSVAHAVRASMSIPFSFRPMTLTNAKQLTSTLVDGGLLSNFPIDSLDRTDGKRPRWPTFGVTVMPQQAAGGDRMPDALVLLRVGAPPLLERVVMTMMFGRDKAYLDQPWVSACTIQVESPNLSVIDFESPRTKRRRSTRKAMRQRRNSSPAGTGTPTVSGFGREFQAVDLRSAGGGHCRVLEAWAHYDKEATPAGGQVGRRRFGLGILRRFLEPCCESGAADGA